MIEVLIASLILGAALIPMYMMFQQGSKTAVSSRLAYQTSQIARELMEEAQQVPQAKLADWVAKINSGSDFKSVQGEIFRATAEVRDEPSGGDPADKALEGGLRYPDEYKRFFVKLTLSDVGTGTPPKLKKLVMEIKWQETGGTKEKDRSALQKFETILGFNSVDPAVFYPE